MNKKIEEILTELVEIDPSFSEHKDEIRALIAELLEKKPDTRLDQEFVARLRSRLLGVPQPSPFTLNHYLGRYIPYAVVAVLAIALILPAGYYASQQNSGTPVFALNQEIERLPGGAYGTLALEGGGKGGATPAPMADMAIAQDSTNNYSARSAEMAMGSAADAKMMLPVGPITVNRYIYKGEPLELTESSGEVYRRTPGAKSSGQIAAQLRKFNFGVLDLGAYSDARVRSFELVEDKPFGYSIMVSFDEGTIGINPNYTQWPALNGKDVPQQLPRSAMPSNAEAITIASAFLRSHGVSLANYGEPLVQDYGSMGIDAASTEMQYAPEQITVTYPLKISGTTVYEEGAYPYGIQVGVGVSDKRVMSVYGLTSQSYSSSPYQLTTDSDKVLSVLSRGGVHGWVPESGQGVEIKNVDIEVGTPAKVLMHTYSYSGNEAKELFVPALSFPVTKTPSGTDLYYPKNIVIPLATEILNQEPGPVMYDMLR